MKPLTPDDIVDIARYEEERTESRARIIELKRLRRVQVGDLVGLVFENRDTVRFQVQEVMRAERIVGADRIQDELDSYNGLIPGPNALSATLFIEITDMARVREILQRFVGIDHGGTTFLTFGDERVAAEYAEYEDPGSNNRVSVVRHLTFSFSEAQAVAFTTAAEAAIEIAHASYAATASLSPEARASLAEDLV